MVTSRPQDLDSFNFTVTPFPTTSVLSTWSAPYIVGTGLPPSTPIYYEVQMHVEVLPTANAATGVPGSSTNDERRNNVTDYGSMEGLYTAVESLVGQAVHLTSRFVNLSENVSKIASAGGLALGTLAGTHALSRGAMGRNKMLRT
jgi:hypothetical protein